MEFTQRNDIFDRVKRILAADFSKPEGLLTPSATLRGTLMMDSLDLVDLIFFLQREFAFEARLEAIREVRSLDGLCGFIAAQMAAKLGDQLAARGHARVVPTPPVAEVPHPLTA